MKSNPLLRPASLVCLFGIFLSSPLWAANGTWDNTGSTSANWTETTNWVGGTVPNGTSDTATFDTAVGTYGTTGSPILIDPSNLNLRILSFNGTAGNYTIGTTSGNALHMNSPSWNGGIYLESAMTSTNSTVTINAPLVIETSGASVFYLNNKSGASNSLVIAGGITGAADTATTNLMLQGSSASVNTISGVIANGSNNVVHVEKNSSSAVWELTGANTYSGVTKITNGVLRINSAQSLGDGSATNTITLGGTLQSTGGTYDLGANRTITLAGSPTIQSDAGTLTVSGNISHASSGILRIRGAGNTTLSGDISGNGLRLDMAASGGTVTLTGSNTYSGNTTIGNGIVKISAANNLGDGSASNSIFFSGGVLVTEGTFDLGANRTITMGGYTRVRSDSGTLTLSGGISGISTTLALQGDGNITVTGAISHGGALTKSGNGTVRLTNANSYTGTTTINGGILRLDNASAISGANLSMSGGIVGLGSGDFTRDIGGGVGQFKIGENGGGFAAYGADREVNIGGAGTGVAWSSSGFLTSGAVLTLGAADADKTVTFVNPLNLGSSGTTTRTIQVNNGSASVDAIMAGNLTQSGGTQSLVKAGAGTLVLQGSGNAYVGTTTVAAGTLLIDGGLNSGGGAVTVNATGALGGDGDIDRDVNVSGILQAGRGQTGQSLTLGGNLSMAANSVLAFAIDGVSDSDILARTGSGTWTFQSDQKVRITDLGITGTNTYTLITGLDASFGTNYTLSNWQLVDSGSLDGTFSFASNTLYFNVVPEPGSLALVVAGCGALALLRRRRSTRRRG